ncbi:MAG: hypothetical protein LKJ17_07175 [Oscillospiraceae bacterium]|nr:hypothetical protein [Oscillospiraceae bacterium]
MALASMVLARAEIWRVLTVVPMAVMAQAELEEALETTVVALLCCMSVEI